MASVKVEIEGYSVRLGNRIAAVTVGDATIHAVGTIILDTGGVVRLVVHFLPDGSPIPAPTVTSGAPYADYFSELFLELKMMPLWIDLLRNEKPMFLYFNSDAPLNTQLLTQAESVGEEET